MADRVSEKMLRMKIERLAKSLNLPTQVWVREGNRMRSNVGALSLDIAYGGYRLVQIVNEGGGEHDLSARMTKSQLWDALQLVENFLYGIIKHPGFR